MIRLIRPAAILLILIGAGLIAYAFTLPVYSDPSAPVRLAVELPHADWAEWRSQLATWETAHKAFFNWGQGFLALGIALILAPWLLRLYLHQERFRNAEGFFIGWNILWLLRFPGTLYYYWLHQSWFEYPPGSELLDQLILQEFKAWIVGAVITSLFLLAFVYRRTMPNRLQLIRPDSFGSWVRLTILALWEIGLVICVVGSLPDGDVGMIFSCTLAASLLVLLIAAERSPSR